MPKLYYQFGFHYDRTLALNEAMIAAGFDGPYAERLANWKIDPQHAERMTTRVECADYFAVRDQALLAHATQVDPEGSWFSVPLDIHRRAWSDRGLGTGPHPGGGEPARGRPVRRNRGPGGERVGASTVPV